MTTNTATFPRLMRRQELADLFRAAGVRKDMDVMVHSRLSELGFIPNGGFDVIDAFLDVIGDGGTMLVPTSTGQITDPADWLNPPVPAEWVDDIRAALKPFDPVTTLPRNQGMLPECVLHYPGVKRSVHPIASIAAIGAQAETMTTGHQLHEMLGVGSPCHKLYEADGHVLLMGVGFEACTVMHLAEFLADCPHLYRRATTVLVRNENGQNEFVRMKKCSEDVSHFEKLRPAFKEAGALQEYFLDDYRITLLQARPCVDIAVDTLRKDPSYLFPL